MKMISRVLVVMVIAAAASATKAALIWDFNAPTPVSLSTLIADYGGEIQVGDKLFSDFFVSTSSTVGNFVQVPTLDSINVSGTQSNGEWGIVFNAIWEVRPGESVDTSLQFRVRTTDPDFWIVGNTLGIAGVQNTITAGSVSVSEQVYREKYLGLGGNLLQEPIAVKEAYYISFTDKQTFDQQSFAEVVVVDDDVVLVPVAVQEAWIVKDIGLDGGLNLPGNDTGVASLSLVAQTFAQVPEPATIVLLATGTLLIAGSRRREA